MITGMDIRLARTMKMNMKQGELADRLGISQQIMNKLESGGADHLLNGKYKDALLEIFTLEQLTYSSRLKELEVLARSAYDAWVSGPEDAQPMADLINFLNGTVPDETNNASAEGSQ